MGLEIDRRNVLEIMKEMNKDDDETTLTLKEFTDAVSLWGHVLAGQTGKVVRHRSDSQSGHANENDQKPLLDELKEDRYGSFDEKDNTDVATGSVNSKAMDELWQEMDDMEVEEMELGLSDGEILKSALYYLLAGTYVYMCVLWFVE